jgi:lysophospholipase L1-like esterase
MGVETMRKLAVFLAAIALLASTVAPASASSQGHGYLALGDSVAFGTNPLLDPHNAANFTGYPEIVAQMLNVEHVNAGCPGEATGGFISLTGLDNVCRPYRFALHFPLHTTYAGTQLAFAEQYLRDNPRTRLVTINLGANDLFRLAAGPGPDVWPPSTCFTPDAVTYQATCAVQNLNTIFNGLRSTGYNGLIVALTYYALDYRDTSGALLLNSAMITSAKGRPGVLVASGFDAWVAPALAVGGDTCVAGLRIALPTGGCDIHPSPKGRDLLAKAIVDTIAASCEGSVQGCLNRRQH